MFDVASALVVAGAGRCLLLALPPGPGQPVATVWTVRMPSLALMVASIRLRIALWLLAVMPTVFPRFANHARAGEGLAARWPTAPITLRQGARVVHESGQQR
jgi:hypothetical protein